MDNYYFYIDKVLLEAEKNNSFFSASNIFSFILALISIFAIYVAYISIFKSKILDIKFQKFNTLCLQNIEKILSPIDDIFQNFSSDLMQNYRTDITNSMVELQLFLISVKNSLYSDVEISELVILIEEFSDSVYLNASSVQDSREKYFATKLKLFQLLYKYASLNEFKISFKSIF